MEAKEITEKFYSRKIWYRKMFSPSKTQIKGGTIIVIVQAAAYEKP